MQQIREQHTSHASESYARHCVPYEFSLESFQIPIGCLMADDGAKRSHSTHSVMHSESKDLTASGAFVSLVERISAEIQNLFEVY